MLTPASNLFPDTAQKSAGDSASLEAISSQLLESSLFITAPSSPPPANSSLALSNGSSLQAMVKCDDALGRNMNLQSCVSALATIEHTVTTPFSWGPRDSEIKYSFPLPRRWVSCQSFTAALAHRNFLHLLMKYQRTGIASLKLYSLNPITR